MHVCATSVGHDGGLEHSDAGPNAKGQSKLPGEKLVWRAFTTWKWALVEVHERDPGHCKHNSLCAATDDCSLGLVRTSCYVDWSCRLVRRFSVFQKKNVSVVYLFGYAKEFGEIPVPEITQAPIGHAPLYSFNHHSRERENTRRAFLWWSVCGCKCT